MDTKEIVALTEKWLEKIQNITVDYNKAVGELTKVREDYKQKEKKWYNTVLPYAMPILTIIIILIAFGIFLHSAACPNPVDIKFQELEITQHCS